ncbi:hypothetical protein PVAP13_5KG405300 [Panicum virgatum]|uniref:Uncharacterized protein n=1 Tax=Panicum virgatum TaxID=38727 RepID=A0A8T0SNA6_PANVG|nr:hypothetical protein PVAP13_5KG405300 [Panicum virgatum]
MQSGPAVSCHDDGRSPNAKATVARTFRNSRSIRSASGDFLFLSFQTRHAVSTSSPVPYFLPPKKKSSPFSFSASLSSVILFPVTPPGVPSSSDRRPWESRAPRPRAPGAPELLAPRLRGAETR